MRMPTPPSELWLCYQGSDGRFPVGLPPGTLIPVPAAGLHVGRDPNTEKENIDPAAERLLLFSPQVSRTHAFLECDEAGWSIREWSAHGTRVNGEKLGSERRPLDGATHVSFGDCHFVILRGQVAPPGATHLELLGVEGGRREIFPAGTRIPIGGDVLYMGRWDDEGSAFPAETPPRDLLLFTTGTVMRRHARLERLSEDGGWYVTDLGTDHGTWIGAARRGLPSARAEHLPDGWALWLGGVKLTFHQP